MGALSSVLKQRRKELGLTLSQIADSVGVTEATVQRWESGNIKTMRHEKIAKLAEVLKVSPATLMGWEDLSNGSLTIREIADRPTSNLTNPQSVDEEKNKPAESKLDELDKELLRLAAQLTPEQKRRQVETLRDIVGKKDN